MGEMFRGNNSNAPAVPFFKTLQYSDTVSNQLHLRGNLPVEFHSEPVNYLGNIHTPTSLLQSKIVPDAEAILRQRCLQFSLNNETLNNETDIKAGILNQNSVSTGLKLSYDEDERHSSLTCASRRSTPSVFPPLSNEIMQELDRQKEEFDHFIRSQEENMLKGMMDIKQRHTASLLKAMEKGAKKLHEKDVELEMVTSKNKELVENMKRLTVEAQNWCYAAKYNESVVNVLKTNLDQAMQRSKQGREGQGECDVDDAESCIDPNNYLSSAGSSKQNLICRLCRSKEVSAMLMPCRHLCLCKECQGFISVCPVCQIMVTCSLEVFLS